jgi:hypothetical protein
MLVVYKGYALSCRFLLACRLPVSFVVALVARLGCMPHADARSFHVLLSM